MVRITINADDLGISEAVNEAIIQGLKNGLIDRTSLMVNMEGTEDAVIKLKENGIINRAGLHLNIVEGKPLTKDICNTILCDENGTFCELSLKRLKNRLYLSRETRNALKTEIRAQIEKYLEFGCTSKHIDSHEHSHTSISVWGVLEPLLQEYGFETARLSRNIPSRSIHGFNKIYKSYINHKIIKFNKGRDNIDKFGSQDDVTIFLKEKDDYSVIELMIHPILKDGEIVDVFNAIDIKTWKKMFLKSGE